MITYRYEELRHDDALLKKLTGYKPAEFEALHYHFEHFWQAHFSKFTLDGMPRFRQASIRRNSIFPDSRDALLFGLIYLKGQINQAELALGFGIDQPKASKYLSLIERLLGQVLEAAPRVIPKRKQEEILNILKRDYLPVSFGYKKISPKN
ncbi:hypothetical protein P1X15_21905 [Runella sp. MFBS21]|uniref:transposase family protein n=1 Tax=Runella sp. MFBS21 TaxID=3034018 RepID=UPI0023F63F51|nr:transposase family protein [Runella sp. MFBS21]MDF7820291.1 hypothetical protein [Runella sp. MFBS21]